MCNVHGTPTGFPSVHGWKSLMCAEPGKLVDLGLDMEKEYRGDQKHLRFKTFKQIDMIRKATAVWNGSGKEGKGHSDKYKRITVLSATQYSFNSRFAEGVGTNPEELNCRSARMGASRLKS